MTDLQQPTNIRHRIIGVSMLMAFILYLDRVCMSQIVESTSFHNDLNLDKQQTGRILGSFFFSYALMQVPAGWASDRFGGRLMLTIYICLWSFFTMMTGVMAGFAGLLAARLLCGVAEAGAYPTCMAMVRKWMPLTARARASGLIAFGGRIGGTLAPFLTAFMILHLGSWRNSLYLDGALGLVIAFIFWRVVRSSPQEHPGVNAAELSLIGGAGAQRPLSGRELGSALWSFTRSRSLWCNAACQFLTNIGWAFLITWLPTYLKEKHGAEGLNSGGLVTIVLALGMLGQVAGGYYCDWATRRFGLRLGRMVPMSSSMFLCATAYVCCPYVNSTWALIACCAIVSFGTDMANPALWAFMGDVGGRGTAAAGGWGNMWGNVGAGVSSMLVPWLLEKGGADGKVLVFFTLAGSFVLAGILVMGMDATRKLLPDQPDASPQTAS